MRLGTVRTAMAIAALGAALALPATALGATASTGLACHPADDTASVNVTGSGFAPGSSVNVLIDGKIVGLPLKADAAGNVATQLPVPLPPSGGPTANDRAYALLLQQEGASAQATFRAARLLGDFNPGNGDPLTMRVRFSAFGFALGTTAGAPMPTVYVHYVDPRGKVKRTVSLGRAAGPCGTIRRSALRRLFPFSPRTGKWTLQFDTQKRYVKGTTSSRFLFAPVTLDITSG